MSVDDRRRILLVPHFYRPDNIEAAANSARMLQQAGIEVQLLSAGESSPAEEDPVLQKLEHVSPGAEAGRGCELVFVLGGDGTFLRAANFAHLQDLSLIHI